MTAKSIKAEKVAETYKLADKLAVDADSNAITASDDYFESTLGDLGLTMDQVKKLQKHSQDVLAGTIHAAGDLAGRHFKDNEDAKELTVEYDMGYQRQTVRFNRKPEEGDDHVGAVLEYKEPNKGEVTKAMKAVKKSFSTMFE